MRDIACVGHFSIDSILLPCRKEPFVSLGGSVAYVSLAAKCLGAKVVVTSKVGSDFPGDYMRKLRKENVDLTGLCIVENAQTTSFELCYSDDLSRRVLRLRSRAPPIFVEDIPASFKAKAIHIAPIAGEIAYKAFETLRQASNILSVDPQGLLRSFDKEGTVILHPAIDKRFLQLVDVFKSSETEIKALAGLSDLRTAIKTVHRQGAKIVIVTLGKKGAIVSDQGRIHNVPAYKLENAIDPTGAGDAFIGAFLAEYITGEDCLWSSCVGSAAASLEVEDIGPSFHRDQNEVYQRARVIYEKQIKE